MAASKDEQPVLSQTTTFQAALSRTTSFFAPPQGLLGRARARYGTAQVNITIAWACFTLIALSLVAVTGMLHRDWALGFADHAHVAQIADRALLINCLLVAGLSTAVYLVLVFGVLKPVQDYRQKVRSQIFDVSTDQKAQLASLAYANKVRTQQLHAALTDNKDFRGKLKELQAVHESSDALSRAVIENTAELLAIIGGNGLVSELSAPLATALGLQAARAKGRPFAEIFRLFDPQRDNPLEHPLPEVAVQALQENSAVPRLSRVLLTVARNNREPFMMTTTVVKGREGRGLAVLLRFEPESQAAAPARSGQPSASERATGLMGRSAFERSLKELIDAAQTQDSRHALLLIECDNLRRVKDSFGQRASNELFWNIAQMVKVRAQGRGGSYIASPESIGVLLPAAGMPAALALADSIRSDVAGAAFAWQDARFESSVSIGVVEIARHSEGPAVLLDHAAAAVVQARSRGGNGCHQHQPGEALIRQRHSDQELISWLLPRIGSDNSHVISQSILPLGNGGQPLFEVFVRIQDDDGAWLPPGAFMPVIERHELGTLVDLWVLETVLRELKSRPGLLEQNQCASINLCSASLEDPRFADNVIQVISASGIAGSAICFEIREDLALSRQSAMSAFAAVVKPFGVRLALDRYKAMGGLRMLKDASIDFVKIHESLLHNVHGANADPLDRLHLRWVAELCRAARIPTVATGIDDEAAVSVLRELGIDYGQGTALNKLGPLMT